MIERVNGFLRETERSLNEVAEALIWVADEYAATDASCQEQFLAKKKSLQEVG